MNEHPANCFFILTISQLSYMNAHVEFMSCEKQKKDKLPRHNHPFVCYRKAVATLYISVLAGGW